MVPFEYIFDSVIPEPASQVAGPVPLLLNREAGCDMMFPFACVPRIGYSYQFLSSVHAEQTGMLNNILLLARGSRDEGNRFQDKRVHTIYSSNKQRKTQTKKD